MYNPQVHSKSKLGILGHRIVSPTLPVQAQIHLQRAMIHLMLDPGGAYVNASAIGTIAPSDFHAIMQALSTVAPEPSYSKSGSTSWKPLQVVPDANGQGCSLMANGVLVTRILVDPTVQITSTDEPISQQAADADDTGSDSPVDPTVN